MAFCLCYMSCRRSAAILAVCVSTGSESKACRVALFCTLLSLHTWIYKCLYLLQFVAITWNSFSVINLSLSPHIHVTASHIHRIRWILNFTAAEVVLRLQYPVKVTAEMSRYVHVCVCVQGSGHSGAVSQTPLASVLRASANPDDGRYPTRGGPGGIQLHQ